MPEAFIGAVAFGAPALLGVVAALIGIKPVRRLRLHTGDRSWLTAVLGFSALERHGHRKVA